MPVEDHSEIMNEPTVANDIRAFVLQARCGDATVLPRLKLLLDHNPDLWKHIGDLGLTVRHAWAKLLAGDSAVARESLQRRADAMRAELAGDDATPAVTMMVDLVVGCWLETQHAQLVLAHSEGSVAQSKFYVRRAETAQKKFLTAIKTLETLRKLLPKELTSATKLKLFETPAKEATR